MTTVRKLLAGKGSEVTAVPPDLSAYDAVAVMMEKGVGSVMVMEGAQVLGIFAERDYIRRVVIKGADGHSVPVKDVMTSKVLFVEPEQPVEECMALMTEKRIRHLPVMKDNTLVGILSVGDLLKFLISEKEFIIRNFEQYISQG